MDTLRLIGGVVVVYLGFVFVLGAITVLPDVFSDLASFVTTNATHPVVLVDAIVVVTAILVIVLAARKR